MRWRNCSLCSGLMHDDLAAVMPAAPAGIVLPKPDSVADVWKLDRALADAEAPEGPRTAVLAIATETAVAVTALPGYVKSPERLVALSWGCEDLSVELGAVRKAVELNPGNKRWLLRNRHLEPLFNDPEFKKIVAVPERQPGL